jgi:hypothetical protein
MKFDLLIIPLIVVRSISENELAIKSGLKSYFVDDFKWAVCDDEGLLSASAKFFQVRPQLIISL